MNNIKERIYFSYQEILDFLEYDGHPQFPNDKNMSQSWFTDMLEDSPFEFAVYTLSEFFTDELLNNIVDALMGIVYNRHAYDYLVYKEIEYNGDESIDSEVLIKAFSKLINVINNTIPKYVPILQQNEIYSTNPVAPAESESNGETRFNDTPQNIGEYGDIDHTTNISNSRSSSVADTGSVMERLSELFKNFKSIILEWSNEFNQCFIKEEQIHD